MGFRSNGSSELWAVGIEIRTYCSDRPLFRQPVIPTAQYCCEPVERPRTPSDATELRFGI